MKSRTEIPFDPPAERFVVSSANAHQSRPDAFADGIVRAISFDTPERLTGVTSWHSHIPFAFWIVEALRPRVLVELGTHKGDSYCAFAQAVDRSGLNTLCYAIDTWRGDFQAGFYGDEVFDELRQYHDSRYGRFSRLIRSTFDDAAHHFAERSIDLLHIDGSHTYEAVKHDFETWLPKLSNRGVVLFHDIDERESGFEVWRLWDELASRFPSFAFHHGHGLGVLGVGADIGAPIRRLTNYDETEAEQVRRFFYELGGMLALKSEHAATRAVLATREIELVAAAEEIRQAHLQSEQVEHKAAELRRENQHLLTSLESLRTEKAGRERELADLRKDHQRLISGSDSVRNENVALKARAQEMAKVKNTLLEETHRLWNSSSWKLFRPLRNIIRSFRGYDRETEPSPDNEADALRTVIGIRQSFSWELTAPLRLLHRSFVPTRPDGSGANSVRRDEPVLRSLEEVSKIPERTTAPSQSTVSETAKESTRLFMATRLEAFLGSEQLLRLPCAARPQVSIILVLWNQAALTFGCLSSIAESLALSSIPSEVLIVDNGSTDQTDVLLQRIEGATVIANRENLGYLRAINQAAARAKGEHLLLLNNDAQLLPGTTEAALRGLDCHADVGAVGGRLILPDGKLQEAGSIVWSDGSCLGYGRGDSPTAPEYMFRRAVDFCSGAFLLTRRALFEQLGGFDEAFVPAYYEETDYCMRLWEAGFRVLYEPDSVVLHYEFGSSEKSGYALQLQQAHRTVLVERHRTKLLTHLAPSTENVLAARSAIRRARALVIDDRVPHQWLGAGSPRMKRILGELAAADVEVTFFPALPSIEEWRQVRATIPPEVEVMQGHALAGLERFLEKRRGYYRTILVSRPHNMKALNAIVDRRPELIAGATLVYDAEALFASREILERRMRGEPLEQRQAEALLVEEAMLARKAQLVLSVSSREAQEFRRLGVPKVEVLGHALEAMPGSTPFAERHQLLFVGRLAEEASPNVDAVCWFVREVLPLLRDALGEQVHLIAAGATGAPSITALNSSDITLLGPTTDLTPYYDQPRIFVAPTRYSAGVPLKIYEAAAHGLPTVATPLLAEQLGWKDEESLLVGMDAKAFATQCARLYREEALWHRVRENALTRVRSDCNPVRFKQTITRAIDAAQFHP